MNDRHAGPSANAPAPRPAEEAKPPARSVPIVANRLDSRDLFLGVREIVIAHGGDAYRLRLTSQNKLILTK